MKLYFRQILCRIMEGAGGERKGYVKNTQKILSKKSKIVQTFSGAHGIIITVKTPQYII